MSDHLKAARDSANLVLFEQSVDELSEVNEIIELRVGRFPLPRGKKSASTDCPNTTANLAYDEHCNAWDALNKIPEPTLDDLAKWLAAKEELAKAQDKFENIVRQIYSIK
jgi:hypothetical protein